MPQIDVRNKLRRAEAEVASGRSWRAKEILRGCVGSADYALNPELLEAYGALLDRLGDRYEAGKYLFLAGSTDAKHQEAIAVYMDRNRRATANDLVAQFPAAFRHQGLGHLPDSVKAELERRGIDARELSRMEPRQEPVFEGTWKDTAVTFGCIALLGLSLLFCVIGLAASLRWVSSYIY